MNNTFTKIHSFFLKNKWKMTSPKGKNYLLNAFKKDFDYGTFKDVHIAHKHGFALNDWNIGGVTKDNYNNYLSTAEYYNMHPINGWKTIWIDDKLTLKYMCYGTELNKYMPDYYFEINEKGNIFPLMDYQKDRNHISANDIADLLEEKQALAIKKISGSLGIGFLKASYKDRQFYLNEKAYCKNDFIKEISELRNYIITDYFLPNKGLAIISDSAANTIRVLVGRINGKLEFLKGFIRFGTTKSGFVENYNRGGVLCYIDENGIFNSGNILDLDSMKNHEIAIHPDSKVPLKGAIPCWSEICNAIRLFDEYFPQLNYLGFDFVVTSNSEAKILEINSLSSLDSIQNNSSAKDGKLGLFFGERIKEKCI